MDADNEFAYRAEALRCHACRAVARGGERFSQPGSDPQGLFISVSKVRSSHG